MTPLLQAELIKLRTTRTFAALVAAALAVSLLFVVLVATIEEPTEGTVLNDVFQADQSSMFILILAIVGITGEWRHRTITSSLLAAPHRLRFLAAKMLAFAAAGLTLSLIVSITISIVGLVILGLRDLPTPPTDELLGLWATNAAIAALLGAFGVGVGAIVRNQVGAVVGVLVMTFVLAPILASLVPEVARFEPTRALPGAIADREAGNIQLREIDPLEPGVAALVMLAWISATFAAAAALLRARDLH